MTLVKTNATYDDLVAVPDRLIAEIIDGHLHVSPHPSIRHILARDAVCCLVGNAYRRDWWVLIQPELHLGDDVIVPDVVAWRRERLPVMPDAPWMTLPPDWVCEVLTPETEQLDRVDKLRIYQDEGVGHVWFVKPAIETLEVYRRHAAGWTLVGAHGGDAIVRAEPFDAIELELGHLWDAPRP